MMGTRSVILQDRVRPPSLLYRSVDGAELSLAAHAPAPGRQTHSLVTLVASTKMTEEEKDHPPQSGSEYRRKEER